MCDFQPAERLVDGSESIDCELGRGYSQSMTVSPQYLAEHYDDIASAVNDGETIEVSLPEKPVLRLVPSEPKQSAEQTGSRVLGGGTADVRFLLDNWDEVDREWRKSFDEKFGSDETR